MSHATQHSFWSPVPAFASKLESCIPELDDRACGSRSCLDTASLFFDPLLYPLIRVDLNRVSQSTPSPEPKSYRFCRGSALF
jgi:hypothetical protein